MKITIEPTDLVEPGTDSALLHPTVSASLPTDEVRIEEVAALVRGLLIAYGYAPETVAQCFIVE